MIRDKPFGRYPPPLMGGGDGAGSQHPVPRPLFDRSNTEEGGYGVVEGEQRPEGGDGRREGEWEKQQPSWQADRSREAEQAEGLPNKVTSSASGEGQEVPPLFPTPAAGRSSEEQPPHKQQVAQPEPLLKEHTQNGAPGTSRDSTTIPGLGDLEKTATPPPSQGQTHQVIASLGKIVSQLQTLQSLPKVQSESDKQLSEETKQRVAALLANESDSDGEQEGKGEESRYHQHEVSAPPTSREFDGSFDVKPHVYSTYNESQRSESGYGDQGGDDHMVMDKESCEDQRPLSPYSGRPAPPNDMEYPPGRGYPHSPPLLDRPRELPSHDYNHSQRYPLDSRPVPPPQDQWYEREQYRGELPGDRPLLRGELYDSQPPPPERPYERYPERERSITSQMETIDYSHGALPTIQSVDYNHGQPTDFRRDDYPPPPPHHYGYPPPPAPVQYDPGPFPPAYGLGGGYPPAAPFSLQPGYFPPPGFDPRDAAAAASLYAAYAAGGKCGVG